MDEERASRLDDAARRGEAELPPVPRANRVKPWAAAVLVAGLAAAWLAVTGSQHSSPARSAAVAGAPSSTTAAASPPPVVRVDTVSLRAALHAPPMCTDVPGPAPALACVYAHVRVDARLLSPNAARRAYPAAGSHVAQRGEPACAAGRADERAWSRPSAPSRAAGRYSCRFEIGRAAIWWYDDRGVIAHVVADDDDLRSLFTWWRAHLDG